MVYCQQCGASNDIMNSQCHRCGRALTPGAEAVPAAMSSGVSPTAAQASGTSESPPSLEIGQGLELPDWLKRAAAETPPALSSSASVTPNLPPTGFHVAPGDAAVTESIDEPAEPELPPRPLPPVPNAGLPSAMPEWLRSHADSAEPEQRPLDPADTTSFISENDLPEWIRQIAAADAVKEAENERLAAETAQAEEAGSARRPSLPGETAPSATAANPWLARREGASAEQAWGGPAAVAPASDASPDPLSASSDHVTVEANPAPEKAPEPKRGFKLSLPATKPDISLGGDGQQSTLRVILLAAAAVILLVLLAGMLL